MNIALLIIIVVAIVLAIVGGMNAALNWLLWVALIVGVILWSRQPDYAVLFSNLAEKDGGAVVASLQQQNIPYKFSDNGNAMGPMTGATRPVWPEAAAFSSTNCFLIYDAC